MSTPIFVQDVTLRDGMHAVRHRITPEDVKRIVTALDQAGVDAIEVAHGDGLAGGSVNYGPGSHTDWAWIEAAASVLKNARLTTLLLPGVGTVHELERAWERGRPFGDRETSMLKDIAVEQRAMTIRMLVEGHADPVSAKRLGVSPRTYAGYVADLKAEYDAQTRFQLGYTMGRMGLTGKERPGEEPTAS